MIKFLRIGPFGLIKKIRIAFSLLRLSTKAVFFEHHRYFIFCILLTLIQFVTFISTGFIHSKLRLSLMLSESLAGLNFFEILFESVNQIKTAQILMLALLLVLELFLIYIICSAVSWFIKEKLNHSQQSILSSFAFAVKKSKQLIMYALLQTVVLFVCALFDGIGNVFYFAWQLLTIFNIQFITFESVTVFSAIWRSAYYFMKNFMEVLSIDALIDLALIITVSGIYYFSQQSLVQPIKALSENYLIAFCLLYLVSILYVLEAVTFSLLYLEMKKNRS
jgi:hypothetical protein